jgi:hypothetical protein
LCHTWREQRWLKASSVSSPAIPYLCTKSKSSLMFKCGVLVVLFNIYKCM